ncbi:LacI family transcriptional regulator [Muricaecibacterium torontonense]|uniref:LacI family transcriptional regulator n=2 Tax=Coriobacteriales TaxID=84999 RepID=A0A4S2F0R2_9ACTN|nr:LacI family transcriptional regulator [Muricaecibacterium torontonense]
MSNRLHNAVRRPMGRTVTVRDIAEKCGVSVATVSRVINNNGRFSQETEHRVRAAIEELGYQPNQMARALRARRTDAIGVIVPSIANEFYSSVILSLQGELFDEGFSIIIYNTNGSVEMERQCHAHLAAQNVAGIISVNSHEDVRLALDRPVPTVYIDRFLDPDEMGSNVASVSSDNFASGKLAAEELWASGSRHPVTITPRPDAPVTEMRTSGFVRGLKDLGYELPAESIFTPQVTGYETSRIMTERLISSGYPFDGIFAQTDWEAIGALEVLRSHHIRVPEEIAVVGHDDIMIAQFGRPPLTTIHQDAAQIGTRTAHLILSMVRDEPIESNSILVPVGLVRRESTRRADL